MEPSTSPAKVKRLKRIILGHCVPALQEALKKREGAIEVITGVIDTDCGMFRYYNARARAIERDIRPQNRMLQADRLYEWHLSLAVAVATLYGGVYADEPHRIERILTLLASCIEAGNEFLAVFEDEWTKLDAQVVEEYCRIKSSVKGLEGMSECIRFARDVREADPTATNAFSSNYSSGQEIISFIETTEESEHLKPVSLFEWTRDLPILPPVSKRDYPIEHVTVQKLNVNFQQLGTPMQQALYPRTLIEPRHHQNFVNAIWLSPGFEELGLDRDAETYAKLCDVVSGEPRIQGEEFAPMNLALLVQELKIEVGIIFNDNPSFVVWPTGHYSSTRRRTRPQVIVLCRRLIYEWRWAAVRFLGPGEQRLSGGHETPSSTNLSELHSPESQAVINQPQQDCKTFPFLRLPAELRNRVYEKYFDNDYGDPYNSAHMLHAHNIWRICRQVRDEALPIILAQRPFVVDPMFRDGVEDAVSRSILRPNARWLSGLPSAAHISRVVFRSMGVPRPVGGGRWCEDLVLCKDSTEFSISEDLSRIPRREGKPRVFEDLVKIVVEDRKTAGLSLNDVAAISCALMFETGKLAWSWMDAQLV